jgi:predicted dehydrogenase
MKIGILGMGIGKVFAKACQNLGYEVQVYDLDKEKCKGFPYNFNLEKDCQKIIVCLPDELHYKVSKRLIEKRKDVLLVKPATKSIKKLRRLYKLAQKNNVVFKVALNNRFRKEIPKEDFDVFKAQWIGSLENVPRWRDKNDVYWDLGIHLVDLFLFSRKSKKSKGFFQVAYGLKEESFLKVEWWRNNKKISEIKDGVKGRFNDEYTFQNCVLDWLNTKKTLIDKNYIKAMKIISNLKKVEKGSSFNELKGHSLIKIYE